VHAPDCIAGIEISDCAPQVRRPVADAGRYAALKHVGRCLGSAAFALIMSMAASALEPNTTPKCNSEVRVLRIAQVSEYYPAHQECMNVPFSALAQFVVSTSGAVSGVQSITIAGALETHHVCIHGVVTDLLKMGLRLTSPSQPCVSSIRVSSK
jgi:hypothetical protein